MDGSPVPGMGEGAPAGGQVARVRELCEPFVGKLGCELVDVEVSGGVARIVLDRAGGVDVETLGEVAHVLSGVLDASGLAPSRRYALEVTSPGLERPLRTPEQFARAVGEQVAVKMAIGSGGERRVRGLLAGVDDGGVTIETQGQGDGGAADTGGVSGGAGRTVRIAFADIERARTVFDWGAPTPRPGRARAGAGRSTSRGGGRGSRADASGSSAVQEPGARQRPRTKAGA